MLERYRGLIFGAVIVAIGAGIVSLLAYRPPPVTITIHPPPPTNTPGPVTVYVTGAVATPGAMLILPPGSRVADAIAGAGGFGPEAEQGALNLARFLRDGEQIHIPVRHEPAAAGGEAMVTAEQTINVNIATAEELQRLPGVGPALAQAIIDYRNQHGPYQTLADLDDVPGVGPTRLEQWAGRIRFE